MRGGPCLGVPDLSQIQGLDSTNSISVTVSYLKRAILVNFNHTINQILDQFKSKHYISADDFSAAHLACRHVVAYKSASVKAFPFTYMRLRVHGHRCRVGKCENAHC